MCLCLSVDDAEEFAVIAKLLISSLYETRSLKLLAGLQALAVSESVGMSEICEEKLSLVSKALAFTQCVISDICEKVSR